jgi:glycosyltransferase involved in cell wall biosynthesis
VSLKRESKIVAQSQSPRNEPYFSVVMPSYNARLTIEATLRSVQAQTINDWEVVIVDNHSEDGTVEIVERMADPRFNIVSTHNEGIIAHSRNVGIREARGQWVAFLDADDIWRPEKLEAVKAAALANPTAILVTHDVQTIDHGVPGPTTSCTPERTNAYEALLFDRNSLLTVSVAVRKSAALEQGGFSENRAFVTVEDYEFWLRLALIGEFVFLPTVLGEWHAHGANNSRNSRLQAAASVAVRSYHLDHWLEVHPQETHAARMLRSRIWSGAGHSLILGRQFRQAIGFSLRSIRLNPFNWKAWAVLTLGLTRVSR